MKKKIKKLEKRVKELERVVFERSETITTNEAIKGIDVVNEEKPFDLTGLRVEVGNAENSRKLQEYAFKKGFKWCVSGAKFSEGKEPIICFYKDKDMAFCEINETPKDFDGNEFKPVHYNDIKHHIEGEATLRDALNRVYGSSYGMSFNVPKHIKLSDFLDVLKKSTDMQLVFEFKDKDGDIINIGDLVSYNGKGCYPFVFFPEYAMFGLLNGDKPLGRSGSSTKYEPYILNKYHRNKIKKL